MTSPTDTAQDRLRHYKAWGLLILLAVIWGSSFSFVHVGLKVFTPVQVASLRVASAGVFLFPLILPALTRIPRKRWFFSLVSGLLGVFIPAFLFAYAQTRLNPAVSSILNALTPIFTLLLSVLFFQQKAEKSKWIGMGIGFSGSALLTLYSNTDGSFQLTIFPFLIIIGTICYALNANLSKVYLQGISPVYLTALSQLWISILSFLVLLGSGIGEQWNAPVAQESVTIPVLGITTEWRWYAFWSVVLLGLTATAIAMLLFNKLMQMSSAVFASTVTYLIPLVAIAWELVGGVYPSLVHIASMVLIIAGVYLANKK